MRFESKLDLTFKQVSEKHVTVSGLKGGNAYHFSIEAGLGEFDIKRLFFILPANEYRKKNYTLGPANIDFAGDNKYLPPRMNCFINGVFSYAIWFDAPSLVELLNDPDTNSLSIIDASSKKKKEIL